MRLSSDFCCQLAKKSCTKKNRVRQEYGNRSGAHFFTNDPNTVIVDGMGGGLSCAVLSQCLGDGTLPEAFYCPLRCRGQRNWAHVNPGQLITY